MFKRCFSFLIELSESLMHQHKKLLLTVFVFHCNYTYIRAFFCMCLSLPTILFLDTGNWLHMKSRIDTSLNLQGHKRQGPFCAQNAGLLAVPTNSNME